MGEMRNARRILVGKPERTRPQGTSGCRWDDDDYHNNNSNMELRKLRWNGMD
jgi:hypothetical protein